MGLGVSGRWLTAATVAGAACLVADHLHVAYAVLFYPHPSFWGQAFWVFPLFFFSTIAVLSGVKLVCPDLPRVADRSRTLAADTIAFLAAYTFTAVASPMPNLVLFVLLGAWMVRVVRGMPVRVVAYCLVTAVSGTAFEITLSHLGGFTYLHPDFLGVPRWLPALYLHVGVAGTAAYRMVGGALGPATSPAHTTR